MGSLLATGGSSKKWISCFLWKYYEFRGQSLEGGGEKLHSSAGPGSGPEFGYLIEGGCFRLQKFRSTCHILAPGDPICKKFGTLLI